MKKILNKIRRFSKIFEKIENYDDLLEMTVPNNRYSIWVFRILFCVFIGAAAVLLFQNII